MIYSDNYKRLKDYSIYEKEFDEFYQAHEKILIYGTGRVSSLITQYFEHRNLKFEFYCATKRKVRRKAWIKNNDSIKIFDEIRDTIDDSYGIVLAMHESNAQEVAEYLRMRNVANNVFNCSEFLYYVALFVYHKISEKVIIEDNLFKSIDSHQLRKDTFYIVIPYSLGDVVAIASLVHAFKKEYGMDRVCLIIKKSHSDIPDFFDSVDEKIVSDELVEICRTFSIFTGVYRCQNYLYSHFPYNIKNFIFTDTLLSSWKSIMCIDERSERERARFKRSDSPESQQKSVILMPHALSIKLLPTSFWEKLAERLIDYGYVVYTNIKDETEYTIKGTQAISKSVADIPSFAEKCSLVIALRSGICDLLAFTKTKMIIVTPTWAKYYDKPEFDDITDSVKRVLFDPQRDDEENVMMVLKSANLDDIEI